MPSPRLAPYHIGEGVVAFSTTRHGGVSKGCYGEFNINAYCGDAPEAVHENREALACELGIQSDHIVLPHQNHGHPWNRSRLFLHEHRATTGLA